MIIIWSDDDDDNNNSINDINFYETYLAGDVDIHEEILPTDSITVRNQLLLENIDINLNVDNLMTTMIQCYHDKKI